MIRGRFDRLWPTLDAAVSFPRLGAETIGVTFLLDTGAVFSVVHPRDTRALGIDVTSAFGEQDRESGRGIGGTAWYFLDDMRMAVNHADGDEVTYLMPVHVAVPTADNADYPSFLGMDFLMHFVLTMSHRDGIVELR